MPCSPGRSLRCGPTWSWGWLAGWPSFTVAPSRRCTRAIGHRQGVQKLRLIGRVRVTLFGWLPGFGSRPHIGHDGLPLVLQRLVRWPQVWLGPIVVPGTPGARAFIAGHIALATCQGARWGGRRCGVLPDATVEEGSVESMMGHPAPERTWLCLVTRCCGQAGRARLTELRSSRATHHHPLLLSLIHI